MISTHGDDILHAAADALRSDPYECIRIVDSLFDQPGLVLTGEQQCRVLLMKARSCINLGLNDDGVAAAERAHACARTTNDPVLLGLAENELGILSFVRYDHEAAIAHYQKAKQLFEQGQSVVDLARVNVNLGNLYHRLGQLSECLKYYEEGLLLARMSGARDIEAKILSNSAAYYESILCDVDRAIEATERAVELHRELGDQVALAKGLSNLGIYLRAAGKQEESLAALEESLTLKRQVMEPDEILLTMHNLVKTMLQLGRMEEADAILREGEATPTYAVDCVGSVMIRVARAAQHMERGDFHLAVPLLESSNVWLHGKGVEDQRIEVIERLAVAYQKVGRHEEAAVLFRDMLYLRYELDERRGGIMLSYMRGRFELEKERSASEIDRLRNVELADAVRRLEQASKEKSEYLAFIAHELKEPLSTIRSIVGLLATDRQMPIDHRMEFNRQVFDISTRMFDLVADLLARSRDQEIIDTLTVLDARPVWEHVAAIWYHRAFEKGITLVHTIHAVRIPVEATERSLVTIVENLLSNAVKFSRSSSTVEMHVRCVENDDAGRVVLSVRDEGPGLSAADMEELFGAWTSLSARPTSGELSTGLGLHLVKREVERLGGRVWCESVVGQGATFFVELPLASRSNVRTIKRSA